MSAAMRKPMNCRSKVLAMRNELHYKTMYNHMFNNKVETVVDCEDVVWHIADVENVLMVNYGWDWGLTYDGKDRLCPPVK